MRNKDDLPETPDWQGMSRPWDERMCCPAECADVCDLPTNITLSDN